MVQAGELDWCLRVTVSPLSIIIKKYGQILLYLPQLNPLCTVLDVVLLSPHTKKVTGCRGNPRTTPKFDGHNFAHSTKKIWGDLQGVNIRRNCILLQTYSTSTVGSSKPIKSLLQVVPRLKLQNTHVIMLKIYIDFVQYAT